MHTNYRIENWQLSVHIWCLSHLVPFSDNAVFARQCANFPFHTRTVYPQQLIEQSAEMWHTSMKDTTTSGD